MRVFFDFEFTGLHQKTTPVSMAMVTEDGSRHFYAEFTDYSGGQVDKWLLENVLPHLELQGTLGVNQYREVETGSLTVRGIRQYIGEMAGAWLTSLGDRVEMWGDVLAYDWVLFCELFGGAQQIPTNIHYIPRDLSYLLAARGHDIDVDRVAFVGLDRAVTTHHALSDTLVSILCYRKLMES